MPTKKSHSGLPLLHSAESGREKATGPRPRLTPTHAFTLPFPEGSHGTLRHTPVLPAALLMPLRAEQTIRPLQPPNCHAGAEGAEAQEQGT